MKICRIQVGNQVRHAYKIGEELSVFRSDWSPGLDLPASDGTKIIRDKSSIQFLPPVSPSKIVCVGRNYAEHAKELNNPLPDEPLLFLKAPSALITEGEAIHLPRQSGRVEHEGEVGVVIGRRCGQLSDNEDPLEYVLGFVCVNDVTARDVQRHDVQFTRGKSFDTFCPVSRFIETDADIYDVGLEVLVNGEIRQQGRTRDMIFDIPFLIRYISDHMTLLPGDLIATGTPSGVSRLFPGDVCEVRIEGIGSVSNPVC